MLPERQISNWRAIELHATCYTLKATRFKRVEKSEQALSLLCGAIQLPTRYTGLATCYTRVERNEPAHFFTTRLVLVPGFYCLPNMDLALDVPAQVTSTHCKYCTTSSYNWKRVLHHDSQEDDGMYAGTLLVILWEGNVLGTIFFVSFVFFSFVTKQKQNIFFVRRIHLRRK